MRIGDRFRPEAKALSAILAVVDLAPSFNRLRFACFAADTTSVCPVEQLSTGVSFIGLYFTIM